jgi:hypothetical protein
MVLLTPPSITKGMHEENQTGAKPTRLIEHPEKANEPHEWVGSPRPNYPFV